jgi:diphthine methyl ester acylhydrolase
MTESMDHYETPLNACSLESLQKPIPTAEGPAWPIITSCYNLEKDGSRTGHLDLFLVKVPQHDADPLQFGDPHLSFGCRSGILDGKWFPKNASENESWWFASARSSGDIGLHTFILSNVPGEEPIIAGQTSSSTPVASATGAPNLCLSVNWDTTRSFDDARIVSSYSNGKVAVHDVARCEDGGIPELIERDCWTAHTLFANVPAEVWSCAFGAEGKLVITGADDAKIKFWDTRTLTRPVQVLGNCFQAGVTVISPHPRNPNLVAAGSYDETIGIFDVRYTSQELLSRSGKLGGGVWRIQWHPELDDKMLLAVMHGGCRVVQLDPDDDFRPIPTVAKEFLAHESMAYGADWLVSHDETIEAAASCSFYDRACYLWNTK